MLDIFYSVPLMSTYYFNRDFNPIIESNNFYAIKFALWLGADVNQANQDGYTALILAALKGHKEIVKLLLDVEGINVNQGDELGYTALISAASEGHKEIVKLLLDVKGINVNQGDELGYTPLIRAASCGRTEIVKLLLDVKGINVNQATKYGYTALRSAASEGHKEIVKLFLDIESINVNQGDKFGYTAFMWAALRGHTEIAKLLLTNGEDPSSINSELSTSPKIKQLIINTQTAWNKIFNGIVANDYSEAEDLITILSKKQSYKISLKFFRGSLGLNEKEKSFMDGEYFKKVTLDKLLELSKSLERHVFKNLPHDTNLEVLKYSSINDIKKLNIVFKGIKVIKSSEELPVQKESLLSPKVEYVLGNVVSKPLAKCTVSYVDNLYHDLKVDQPSYGECLQHGYFSKAGLLENLSGPFLISMVPIFLNICGWPGIVSQDSYKFLEVLTSKITSPIIKAMAPTAILEALPLVGEILLDGAQYVGDSIYCSVIDCTLV